MPKGKFIEPTTKRNYTVDRLQKLRLEADKAGDVETRDILAKKILELGGKLPTAEIPPDESKLSRLERLHLDALEVGDTESAEKLAGMIAEEQKADDWVDDVVKQSTIKPLPQNAVASEPHAPHNGRKLADAPDGIDPSKPANWEQRNDVHGDPVPDPESAEEQITLAKLPADVAMNIHPPDAPPLNGGMDVHVPAEPPPAAPESDGEHAEGPIATQPVNNGTASISAVETIKVKGFDLAEIPAKDGQKVTIHDVRRYERMLSD